MYAEAVSNSATCFAFCCSAAVRVTATAKPRPRARRTVIHLEPPSKLTGADSDSLNELLPPAVCANHQGQVRLLNELVHRVLWMERQRRELGAVGLKPAGTRAHSHALTEKA